MKNKILLINPGKRRGENVIRYDAPISLLNLATFMKSKGYECDIWDCAVDEQSYMTKIKHGEYFLIGLTMFVGDFMKIASAIIRRIRIHNPMVKICLGGVMPSIFPEEFLKSIDDDKSFLKYDVDYIIRYEGEYTLFELAEHLTKNIGNIQDIKGLSWKKGTKVYHNSPRELENNLDNFPPPDWSIFGDKCNYDQIPYYFRIMTSKNCPFSCGHCYNKASETENRRWRYRSVKHIIKEVEQIHAMTGAKVFTLGDDNFLVKKDRAIELFNYFKQRGFYIEQCIAHLHNLDDGIIEAMSGVVQTVIYAIESASPRLLKLLNKPMDLEKIPEVNKKLFENGMTTIHNFMIGLPTETDEDLKANYELMKRLKEINPYVRSVCYFFLPLPKTPMWDFVESEFHCKLPCKLADFANVSFEIKSGRGAPPTKFRPHLTKERILFLKKYSVIFQDLFQTNNLKLSNNSINYLKHYPELKEFFKDYEEINKPTHAYKPYVLELLKLNEHVDLKNALKNEANLFK